MSRDLHSEVVAFLAERGASQAKTIAAGVRARLADVAALLAQDGFSQADRPEGAHPHGVYFVASPRIPYVVRAGSRAAVLLGILSDGEWHSREEIFELAGGSFLTNNAASELRRAGHDVVFERGGYRLVSLAAPESPTSSPCSGAVSEPDRVAA